MADPTALVVSAPVATTTLAVPTEAVVKAVTAGQVEAAQAQSQALANASLQFHAFGYSFNMIAVLIGLVLVGILYMFYQIQKQNKLDFADMITKDGRAVSLSKVLQLIGGATATWIMIKLTLTNAITESLFAIYLTYVGAVEGYSKFVAAKYGYQETSIKDGGIGKNDGGADADGSAGEILKAAATQATDAEASAKDAKVSIKNAAIDLKNGKDK